MPWSSLVGNYIAQMIVEHIDDLVVGNSIIMGVPCITIRSAEISEILTIEEFTKNVRRRDFVCKVSPEVS